MKTWSLPFGLCWWVEPKLGLGLSLNLIKQRFGYEPFIIGQFAFLMFFVAPKCEDYGWTFDLEESKYVRVHRFRR